MNDNQIDHIDWTAVADFLESAQNRIKDSVNWCKADFAQSVIDGRIYAVETDDPRACRFCAMGAFAAERHLQDITDESYYSPVGQARRLLHVTNERINARSIFFINDVFGHTAVMGVYDEAIKVARTKAKEAIAA